MATTAVPIAASMVTPINPMMLPLIFYPLERSKMRPIPTKETEKGTMRICPNGLPPWPDNQNIPAPPVRQLEASLLNVFFDPHSSQQLRQVFRPQMSIALQHLQSLVAGDGGHLHGVQALLEEAAASWRRSWK